MVIETQCSHQADNLVQFRFLAEATLRSNTIIRSARRNSHIPLKSPSTGNAIGVVRVHGDATTSIIIRWLLGNIYDKISFGKNSNKIINSMETCKASILRLKAIKYL